VLGSSQPVAPALLGTDHRSARRFPKKRGTVHERTPDGGFEFTHDERTDDPLATSGQLADRERHRVGDVEREFERKHRYVRYLVRKGIDDYDEPFALLVTPGRRGRHRRAARLGRRRRRRLYRGVNAVGTRPVPPIYRCGLEARERTTGCGPCVDPEAVTARDGISRRVRHAAETGFVDRRSWSRGRSEPHPIARGSERRPLSYHLEHPAEESQRTPSLPLYNQN